jgi:selenide,water dikinase
MEMARGGSLSLVVRLADVPFLNEAERLAQAGMVTGASKRNWASYGEAVSLPAGLEDWQRHLLTDPQTSGGLLVACAPESAEAMLRRIREAGYPAARIIGHTEAGAPGIRVVA